jgi:TonB family protein
MNPLFKVTIFALIAGAATAVAETGRFPVMERLRIKSQQMPVYPLEMVRLGAREGKVVVALSVDTKGQLEDLLVIAHTHPDFADAAVAALRRWTFEPATLGGTPVAAVTEITIDFAVEGTSVVSMTPSDTLAAYFYSIHQAKDTYRPHTLHELDRIPTPIAAPGPQYPRELADRGRSGDVTVHFFIDEKGNVRIPSIDNTSDAELGSLAILALRQWKFEAPTCKGVPVLVKASQVFRFRPAAAGVTRAAGD